MLKWSETNMRRILTLLLSLLALGLLPLSASAQIIITPTLATFTHPDAEFTNTASYNVLFFQCTSVSPPDAANPNGKCNGKATSPFQTVTVAKSAVTGTASSRTISMSVAPLNGTLTSMPAGVGFVSDISANGDTSIPGVSGTSANSADSNPFFGSAKVPAAPGAFSIR